MKWRNQFLALVCLLAFGGVGIIYFQHWVIRKPFGLSYLSRRPIACKAGAYSHLCRRSGHAFKCGHHAVRRAGDELLERFLGTDQAAAASAIATGERVNNRAIAIKGDGKPIKSIIELAREYGRATG